MGLLGREEIDAVAKLQKNRMQAQGHVSRAGKPMRHFQVAMDLTGVLMSHGGQLGRWKKPPT